MPKKRSDRIALLVFAAVLSLALVLAFSGKDTLTSKPASLTSSASSTAAPIQQPTGGVEQVTKAITDAVSYVTREPLRFALLLAAIAGLIGGALFLRRRRKQKIEKL